MRTRTQLTCSLVDAQPGLLDSDPHATECSAAVTQPKPATEYVGISAGRGIFGNIVQPYCVFAGLHCRTTSFMLGLRLTEDGRRVPRVPRAGGRRPTGMLGTERRRSEPRVDCGRATVHRC